MDTLQRKTLTSSRSLEYTYYFRAGDNDKPTVVLHHGWPDNAHLYADIVPHLIPTGFSLLIPDLLGYAGTSKPLDISKFSSKDMAAEIIEICDKEGVESIVSLGHDWGSFMAQRLYLWYPQRVVGLVLLNVAYMPPNPDTPVDLQAILQMQEQALGHPLWAYWELFTAPDGAELIESHLESMWTVMHGDQPNWMQQLWCNRGAMREYLEADKRVPLKPYAQDPRWKDTWISRIKRDGIAAPLNWYKALINNVSFNDEKHLSSEVLVVQKPVLFIGCTGDAVCRTDAIYPAIEQKFLPNITVKEIESAHWSPMENPHEMGPLIAAFLQNTKF